MQLHYVYIIYIRTIVHDIGTLNHSAQNSLSQIHAEELAYTIVSKAITLGFKIET